MRKVLEIALLVTLAPLGGCGQELLAGGQREGEVSTVVTDDADGAGTSSAARRSLVPGSSSSTSTLPSGSVEVDASVVLVREGVATVVSVGGGSARVRIAAGDTARLGERSVRAATYTRARVTFTRVEAEVTGGLDGVGIPVGGRVRVRLDQPHSVELPVDLTVEPRGEHRVVIDLNSTRWLLAADAQGVVPLAAFLAAVQVTAR